MPFNCMQTYLYRINLLQSAYPLHWHEQPKVKSFKFAQTRLYKSKFILNRSILLTMPTLLSFLVQRFFIWRNSHILMLSSLLWLLFVIRLFVSHSHTNTAHHCTRNVHILFINGMTSRNVHKRLHIACAHCVLCHSL